MTAKQDDPDSPLSFITAIRNKASRRAEMARRHVHLGFTIWTEADADAFDMIEEALLKLEHTIRKETERCGVCN